jgi:DNA-binding NarL/FixJ family response regulator
MMNIPSVLIIEDHKEYREAVRHFLEVNHVSARVIEASSGEEGVLLARRKKPKVVVTDFHLGGIDGLETAKLIKKHVPQCSIVMLTIYELKEILRRDGSGIIRFFVNKGDLYEQLMPVVNKALQYTPKRKSLGSIK